MANKNNGTYVSEMYTFIGTAKFPFEYGKKVILKVGSHSTQAEGVPDTSNLENEDIGKINIGTYEHENTVTLVAPKYMANEQYCGCKKCNPDFSGVAGQRFLVGSIEVDQDHRNLYIIARLYE